MTGPFRGLIGTRRVDLEQAGMALHPGNAWVRCSRCDQECGLTPSSVALLADTPGLRLFCNRCVDELEPGPHNVVLTPAAIDEMPLIDRLNDEAAGRA